MSKSITKDLLALRRLAEDQGWVIENSGNGHLRWIPPFGNAVMTSSTPAHQRTLDNIKAELKAAGLILNRAEWKRTKRATPAKVTHTITDMQAPLVYAAKLARVLTLAEHSDVAFEEGMPDPTDELLDELLSLEKNGKFDLTCKCSRTFIHPLGMLSHRRKCPVFLAPPTPEEQKESERMKRNMTAPPERERLNCPECPEWFWISQPGDLAEHVLVEHGKEQCPYCEKYWVRARGGLSRHMAACPARPQPAAVPTEPEPEPSPTPNVDALVALVHRVHDEPASAAPVAAEPRQKQTPPKSRPPYKAQPYRYPIVPRIDGLGDYDEKACQWCGRPRGQQRGFSGLCWNPVCWEQSTRYFSERGRDVEAAHALFIESPKGWVMAHVDALDVPVVEVAAPVVDTNADLDAAQALADEVLADAERKAKEIIANAERDVRNSKESTARRAQEVLDLAHKEAGEIKKQAKRILADADKLIQQREQEKSPMCEEMSVSRLAADADDEQIVDALVALLGELPMTSKSLTAVNRWMQATRDLITIREA